jgi:hypothetical protein
MIKRLIMHRDKARTEVAIISVTLPNVIKGNMDNQDAVLFSTASSVPINLHPFAPHLSANLFAVT